MDKNAAHQVRVGAFVTLGLIALILTMFTLGGNHSLFVKYTTLKAQLKQVQGLNDGSVISLAGITNRHPEILSGTPVFFGTRIPVRSFFDYLEGGDTLQEFLHQFPSVKREQAIAVLGAAYETVAANAHTA